MSYAIKNDRSGLRAVSGPDEILADEYFSVSAVPLELSPEALRDQWKQQRAGLVAAIKVTTNAGHTFDGDEESQGRMARAILGLQSVQGGAVTWVLADNSVQEVGAAELTEALTLAGAEQARLWVAE